MFTRNRYGIWTRFNELPKILMTRVRGNVINDLFIAGHFGLLAHYSGKTWKMLTDLYEIDVLTGLAVKDNTASAVGYKGNKAVAHILKRN